MALRARLPFLARSSRLLLAARYSNGADHDTAGSIRYAKGAGAGGSFGKKEKAIEDQYFHNLEVQQLKKLADEYKKHHEEEIGHHEEEIKDLEEQIKRHKEKITRHKAKVDDADK